MPERLHDIDLLDLHKRRPCIVRLEDARWLDGDRGFGAQPAPKFKDPWEHHGEIVVVRPWAPGLGSIRTWAWLLHRAHQAFLGAGAATRFGRTQRWWLRRGVVDVVLPELPTDAKDHDRLVRALWEVFGWRVRLAGAPARLHDPPRLRWRDRLVVAAWLAPGLSLVGSRIAGGLPPLNGKSAVLCAICVGMALAGLRAASHRAPDAPAAGGAKTPLHALRQRVAAASGADPAGYTGAGSFRLGATERSGWQLLPLLPVVPILVLDTIERHTRPASPAPGKAIPWYVGVGVSAAALAALCGALLLGYWLASTRLSLGERGLTVRLNGWYSRPLRIPYASIRHVAYALSMKGQELRLLFHDGHEVSFGFPRNTSRAANEAAHELLLDIEARITSRLTSAGSYRVPGAGVPIRG